MAQVYDELMHRQDDIHVRDLGRLDYAAALVIQRQLQADVIANRDASPNSASPRVGYLLLVEHDPPVVTVSRRKTARQHLIATPQQLASASVEVAETDRGGDITYHGPGQLVVYPILDLNMLNLRLHGYMRLLEQIVIETLTHFGIEGHRDAQATGVWVQHGESPNAAAVSSKICAMGVRVTRWVSMHGLALNVAPNLNHFNLIVPCGLAGRSVTSMQQLLGENCPAMDDVKHVIVQRFTQHITMPPQAQPSSLQP